MGETPRTFLQAEEEGEIERIPKKKTETGLAIPFLSLTII